MSTYEIALRGREALAQGVGLRVRGRQPGDVRRVPRLWRPVVVVRGLRHRQPLGPRGLRRPAEPGAGRRGVLFQGTQEARGVAPGAPGKT
ncbi:hypothetical protein ACWCWD_29520 [Streptomyces sp. NPDC001493]